MGNEEISVLTNKDTRPYKLRIEMLSAGNHQRSAEYRSFSLDSESQFYTLHVSGYSGDAGDSLQYSDNTNGMSIYQNGMKFSTFDQDNDNRVNESCCQMYGNVGWWFKACFQCCLNCVNSDFNWQTNPPNDENLPISRMMIGQTQADRNAYRNINNISYITLAYYTKLCVVPNVLQHLQLATI